MKRFVALYYYRDANRELQSRFMDFDAPSMAAAKRHGKAERQPDERLVCVELDSAGANCPADAIKPPQIASQPSKQGKEASCA